jgi:hypothetical protein
MPPKARRLSIDRGGRCGTLEQAGSPVLSPSLRTATDTEGHGIDAICPKKANGPHSIQLCGPRTPTTVSV